MSDRSLTQTTRGAEATTMNQVSRAEGSPSLSDESTTALASGPAGPAHDFASLRVQPESVVQRQAEGAEEEEEEEESTAAV